MTSLRTLGYFDLIGNSMENVQSLSKLTNLRDLQLTSSTMQPYNLNNKMRLLLGSILGRLNNLKSLTLVPTASYYVTYLDDTAATDIAISGYDLSIPSSPLNLLQRLNFSPRICVFFRLPMIIGQLRNLCVLKIGVREIVGDDVNILRGLPALCVLSLYVHTKPAERIVIGKAGFWVLKYFKFRCCDPQLTFDAGSMRNLLILKLCFNAPEADRLSRIPVGIKNLSSLKEVSAEIGGAPPDESDRRAAELAFRDAIRVHPRCPRVSVKCVNQIFGCKEDHSSMTPEEEYGTENSKHANSRFTFSEWHMLLLLRNKLDNQHDDITGHIPVFDPYSVDPWMLAENGTGELLKQKPQCFFRPLEEATSGHPNQAPSGYWDWKDEGSARIIYSAEGLSIGLKRTMEFYRGSKPSGIKTGWKMEEFTAFQKPTAGASDARLPTKNMMSLCQLYIEPDTISTGSVGHTPPRLLKAEEDGDLKQYGIAKDKAIEKNEVIHNVYGKNLKDEPTGKDETIQDVYGKNLKDEPTGKDEIMKNVYGKNLKGKTTEKDEIVQNVYGENMNKQADITKVQSRLSGKQVTSSTGVDGYSWTKYGQEDILGANPPRGRRQRKLWDWNVFLQYLLSLRPPITLSWCTGAHVIDFLKYLDKFGKAKVHTAGCAYFGHRGSPVSCSCPLRQSWGSLHALIDRLRAVYKEAGCRPESDPFADRAVWIYLDEVREEQANARGILKKKRKRAQKQPAPGEVSSSATAAALSATTTAAHPTSGGEGSDGGVSDDPTSMPPQRTRGHLHYKSFPA